MTEKKVRGFAIMSVERRREVSSLGGKSCPAEKRSFSNRELASEAGKKGAAVRSANMWEAKKHLLEKKYDKTV